MFSINTQKAQLFFVPLHCPATLSRTSQGGTVNMSSDEKKSPAAFIIKAAGDYRFNSQIE